MLEPPSRTSAWRSGFSTPIDYNDNQHNCGGLWKQISLGGRCSICGDADDLAVKPSEAPGGIYATGTIVRNYQAGDLMDVTSVITANHKGFITFKLCPNNDVTQDPTQDCFDGYPLTVVGHGTHYNLPTAVAGTFNVQVQLPDISCSQCIIQWTYTAANGWGVCPDGTGAVGCGQQETFRACADVSISGGSGSTAVPTVAPTVAPTEAPTLAPTVAPTEAPTPAPTVAPTEAPTLAPTVAPTEAPTTETNNGGSPCQSPDGLFPDPEDCSSFYNCAHGMAWKMTCGTYLVFNPIAKVCDWPYNVQC